MNRKSALIWTLLIVIALGIAACTPSAVAPAPAEPSPAESAATTGLERRPWTLVSYINAQAQTVDAAAESPAVVTFQDGSVGGTSGCNSFFGSYTLDGDKISIGQMGSTMMACPEPLMQQEADFLAALDSAASYAEDGETLQLLDAGGNVVATFTVQPQPASQTSLAGVAWSATALGGEGVISSIIVETAITALFAEDGSLSGNSGCNRYTASYTVDGDALHISPAAVTVLLCNAPEGIMEQEQQYLAALESVAAYRIDGDTLELLTADGALIVAFVVQSTAEAGGADAAVPFAAACDELTLGNLAYYIPDVLDLPVRLQDCVYEDLAEPDATSRTVVTLQPNKTAFGEIGGTPSAAAILFVQPSGSGGLYYLAFVQEQDGQPVHVASSLLGKRPLIKSIVIEDNQVAVDMFTEAPDNPSCCANIHKLTVFELQDGQLIQVSDEEITATGA